MMFFCCSSSSDAYTVPLINVDPPEDDFQSQSSAALLNSEDVGERGSNNNTRNSTPSTQGSMFHKKRARRFSISSETFTFSKQDLEEINNVDFGRDCTINPHLDEVKMKRALNKTGFLSGLEEGQLRHLLSRMKKVEIEANTNVIREGDLGDNFYVIESGVYEAWKTKCNLFRSREQSTYTLNYEKIDEMQRDLRELQLLDEEDNSDSHHITDDKTDSDDSFNHLKVKTYSNEGAFGELTLMYNSPRAATIRSKTKGVLWSIDRQTFRKTIVLSRIQQLQKFKVFLESIELFDNLEEEQKKNIAESMKLYTFYDKEYVIKQGERGNTFHMILTGTVHVLDRNDKVLQTLGCGDYFGERALITREARAASVRCVSPMAEIAAMHRADFGRLVCSTVMDKLKKKIESYSM